MPPPFARQGGSAGPEDSTGSPGAGVTGKAEANPSSLSATRSPDSSRETPSATLLSGSAAAAGEEDRLKTGTRLGDFELVRKLGQGGMGEVFLARQISLDREVALKVLPKPLAERGDFVERFQREARTMARLDHPCIVRAYAVDHDRGRHFVAMEYVDGRSMRDWLKQLRRIPVGDAVHVTLRCAEALRAAHSAQTIHRDVKPDNVLVARNGGVKVADFGLAKALDEDMTITESGVGFGTPFYMAPEQARNAKRADQRSDIYALGATLYHLLTGELPFQEESTMELLLKKERGRFTPARQINPDVPERLDLVLDKMMASNPAHRFADCADLISQLQALGLESQALGFVSGVTHRRAQGAQARPATAAVPGTRSAVAALQATVRGTAEEPWIVQLPSAHGKPTLARLSVEQLRRGLKKGSIPLQTRAKRTIAEDFRPLAEFPEFARLVQTRVVMARARSHAAEMENLYAQIARQERWRPVKRRLRDFAESVAGFGSLALWLALIIAVSYGVYVAYPFVMDLIAEELKLR